MLALEILGLTVGGILFVWLADILGIVLIDDVLIKWLTKIR